jgi:phosphoserine phosphatase
LRQPVAKLAQALSIAPCNVLAVEIYLDSAGSYVGFDASSPLVRTEGKAEICRALAARHGALAMVGDGVTDLAARASGAYVIGFGGVTHRQVMAESADYFIADATLARTLEVLLTDAELRDATRPFQQQ